MGIWEFVNKEFKKVHEVQGRFRISAIFRQFRDIATTYDFLDENDYQIYRDLKKYNLPFSIDENYASYSDDSKILLTNIQLYFIKILRKLISTRKIYPKLIK